MKKSTILIVLTCLTLLLTSCNKGQTDAPSTPIQQGTMTTTADTGTKVNLSVEQKKELDDFFSVFSKGGLRPFAEGQLSDDELTSFALWSLGTKGGAFKHVLGVDAINMETQYFGRSVQPKEWQIYGENHWTFENGVFKVISHSSSGGYATRFSQINELRDRGGGTFTASVSVYIQPEEWDGNRYENPTEWKPGPSGQTPQLSGKYHALIRLVGTNNHYILLEYLRDE